MHPAWEVAISLLSSATRALIRRDEPMSRHTSLRVGGAADYFIAATTPDVLAEAAALAQRFDLPHFVLGAGSNICVSDAGIRGMVLQNLCRKAEISELTYVDAGHNLMDLFVRTMQASLSGLEFAVGIPGTVGGALVSNAGAYRANICDLVQEIDVVEGGERHRVSPDWMGFSYRDSRLRRKGGEPATLIGSWLKLRPAPKTEIRLKAKDFQMQRILKQPWEPSAGSWFKNVYDRALAESLPTLPAAMKQASVVPAAYLSEACGCKGFRIGGAGVAPRHANFIVNCGGATASEVRQTAEHVRSQVLDRFGILLEEEVLYVGDWAKSHSAVE